ncbi:hypothetical protein WA026_022403 [Henosepilachna vigintioctopunctata]|uniref:Uncharacterized protein n=1 Tax=Henosepilachna vigintioctopunctata TaxID=420089 RepID=A0AAW1UEE2_9CUCU
MGFLDGFIAISGLSTDSSVFRDAIHRRIHGPSGMRFFVCPGYGSLACQDAVHRPTGMQFIDLPGCNLSTDSWAFWNAIRPSGICFIGMSRCGSSTYRNGFHRRINQPFGMRFIGLLGSLALSEPIAKKTGGVEDNRDILLCAGCI